MKLESSSSHWWLLPRDDAHGAIDGTLKSISRSASAREQAIRLNYLLYGEDVSGYFGSGTIAALGASEDPLPINVVASICDAMIARITKQRPRVAFIPAAGSGFGDWYTAKRRAEARSRFVEGTWDACKHREMTAPWILDGLLAGTGAIKAYAESGRIYHDRTPAENLWVDDADAQDGRPSMLFERRYVDRYALAALYPESSDVIMAAPRAQVTAARQRVRAGLSPQSDQVLVNEAWHLPVVPPTDDDSQGGRHVIAIENHTLRDLDYFDTRFPFVMWGWKRSQRSFWGRSIVDDLYPFQTMIWDCLEMFRSNMRAHGNARTYVERGSKVLPAHLTNGVGDIVEYTGQPPMVVAPVFVDASVWQRVVELKGLAMEQVGASEQFVGARKTPGLNSGVAIREVADIESERLNPWGQTYDQAHVDLADLDLMIASREAKENRPLTVTTLVRQFGETRAEIVRWADVGQPDETFVMQAFPTNALGATPAARKQYASELYADGLISKDDYAAELNIPTVDEQLRKRAAARRLIERRLEDMIVRQRYYPPESYLPLDVCLQMGREAYCEASLNLPPEDEDDASAEVLRLLRKWCDDTTALMQPAPEAAPPMGEAPAGPPEMVAPTGMPIPPGAMQ